MSTKAIVIVPTQAEAAHMAGLGAGIVTGGVGMAETAITVARLLRREPLPEMLILAGIAGTYGDSVGTGESVLVCCERTADLGSLRDGTFEPLFVKEYLCPFAGEYSMFRSVKSNTVSTAGSPFADPRKLPDACRAEIENMEGAPFFALCLDAGVRFLELRTVSNRVGDPRSEWNIPLATQNLARDLKILLG